MFYVERKLDCLRQPTLCNLYLVYRGRVCISTKEGPCPVTTTSEILPGRVAGNTDWFTTVLRCESRGEYWPGDSKYCKGAGIQRKTWVQFWKFRWWAGLAKLYGIVQGWKCPPVLTCLRRVVFGKRQVRNWSSCLLWQVWKSFRWAFY